MRLAKGCQSVLAFTILGFLLILIIAGFLRGDDPILWTMVIVFSVAILGMVIFFRDPTVRIGDGVISPADGKVVGISDSGDRVVVKIFMNLWNIHVNRSPIAGEVLSIEHRDGGHIPAFDKDAESNERTIIDIVTAIGDVRVVQIAGSFARRIVPYVKAGQNLEKGERIGIIRFGSRVDVHLPAARVNMIVKVGDRVRPGQTIAELKSLPGDEIP